eukprot:gene10332-13882_t
MSTTESAVVFIGDLSFFAVESDLKIAFKNYDPTEIRIFRSKKENRCLCYGFITFSTVTIAEKVLFEMSNSIICNRKIRLNWGDYAIRNNSIPMESILDNGNECLTDLMTDSIKSSISVVNHNPECSIYLKFRSMDLTISGEGFDGAKMSEDYLRSVCNEVGDVTDVCFKRFKLEMNNNGIKGFAFIHFESNHSGVQSALNSVNFFQSRLIDSLLFTAEISSNLKTFIRASNDFDLLEYGCISQDTLLYNNVPLHSPRQERAIKHKPKQDFNHSQTCPHQSNVTLQKLQQQQYVPNHFSGNQVAVDGGYYVFVHYIQQQTMMNYYSQPLYYHNANDCFNGRDHFSSESKFEISDEAFQRENFSLINKNVCFYNQQF